MPWPRTPAFHAEKGGSNPVGDADPEITNGLGAFLCAARYRPGFGRASLASQLSPYGCTSNAPTSHMEAHEAYSGGQ